MSESWKHTERTIAKRLKGHRIGCTGKATSDVDCGWLQVEVKHRKQLPQWLKDALAQAKAAAGSGQLGIAILHELGARHNGDLVVMSLKDFEEWFGGNEKERT